MWRFVLCLMSAMSGGSAVAQVEQGSPNAAFAPAFFGQTRAVALPATDVNVSVFAGGLEFPWGIARLPDGRFLVTEKGGALKLISENGAVIGSVSGLPAIEAIRQGGLLDVAVSPDFARDGLVYFTYSKAVRGGVALAAARGVLQGATLVNVEDIFVQSPAQRSGQHFGSRIIPVNDGAWITTGDRGTGALAQQDNTVGKVLWFDGQDVSVWSSGHRNIQGAVLRNGELWTVEHGPRGGDELNRPEQGLNYGWPVISYGINYNGADIGSGIATADGFEAPVYYWDPVIAPGGMGAYSQDGAFAPWRGDFLISSLNPGAVVRLKVEQGRIIGEERLLTDVGRVRDLEVLPDGSVLVLIDAPEANIVRIQPIGGAVQ